MKNIGIITESKKFDKHISDFKKNNINCSKLKVNDDNSSFDTLIVDMGYPLEQSYRFLENIRNDYKMSDVVIFIAVSDKSQLNRLKTSAFGVHAYISPLIEFYKLLKKIKEAHDPEQFRSYINYDGVPLELETTGSLSHISESGAILNSDVSYTHEVPIQIKSHLLDQFGIGEKVVCKLSITNPAAIKTFVSEINFLNLNDKDRDQIRRHILYWSTS